jgi:hypothetical protein
VVCEDKVNAKAKRGRGPETSFFITPINAIINRNNEEIVSKVIPVLKKYKIGVINCKYLNLLLIAIINPFEQEELSTILSN